MVIRGISSKTTRIMKIAILAVSVVFLVALIATNQTKYVPLAIIAIIFSLYGKKEIIDEDGVVVTSGIWGFGISNRWAWYEVNEIVYNRKVCAPNVKFIFIKGRHVREAIISAEDMDKLYHYIKRKQKHIKLTDMTYGKAAAEKARKAQEEERMALMTRPPMSQLKIKPFPMKKLKQSK